MALVALWALLALFFVLVSWPHPKTVLGWILIVVLAPPLYVMGEAFGTKFWTSRLGRGVSEYPSRIGRIGLGVLTVICLWAIIYSFYLAGTWVVARVF